MPLQIPDYKTIKDRMVQEAIARLGDNSIRDASHPINVILTSLSAPFADLYASVNDVVKNSFVTTASDENLDALGRVWGIIRKPAQKAKGEVTFIGTNGVTILAETLIASPNGARFMTIEDTTIANSEVDVKIVALLGGADANAAANEELTLVNPIRGVLSTVRTVGAITGGTDIENDSLYRIRLLALIRSPARSGNIDDYKFWALSSPRDVSRVWVTPRHDGIGTVKILVMMDNKYDNGLPLDEDLTAIKKYIDTQRPLGAEITVIAPTLKKINITIADLNPAANNSKVQDAIKENLKALFLRNASPADTIFRSQIEEAISTASGEISHTLTAPIVNQTSIGDQLLTLGEVSFT